MPIFPRAKLRAEIAKLPQKQTIKQQLKIATLRARLSKQIKYFFQDSTIFLSSLEDTDIKLFEEEVVDTPAEEAVDPEDLVDGSLYDDLDYDEEDESEAPLVLPEVIVLPLPSNIISAKLQSSLEPLRSVERELRKGQANDALEGLRVGLAQKSLLFLKDVNKSTSTKQSTRAWASVRNAQTLILHHAHCYQRAWHSLKSIGNPEDLMVYQKLDSKDLVTVKDITNAKRFGQGSDALAWFWRIGPGEDRLTGEWMEECKLN
jgi:hypothetical protein